MENVLDPINVRVKLAGGVWNVMNVFLSQVVQTENVWKIRLNVSVTIQLFGVVHSATLVWQILDYDRNCESIKILFNYFHNWKDVTYFLQPFAKEDAFTVLVIYLDTASKLYANHLYRPHFETMEILDQKDYFSILQYFHLDVIMAGKGKIALSV